MTSALYMHPWYKMPTLKRKGSFEFDFDHACQPHQAGVENLRDRELASGPRVKRRRCDNLENGFSQLSLNPTAVGAVVQPQTQHLWGVPYSANPSYNAFGSTQSQPQPPSSGVDSVLTGTAPDAPSLATSASGPLPPAIHEYTSISPPDISPTAIDTEEYSWYEPEKDLITNLNTTEPDASPSPSSPTGAGRTGGDDDEDSLRVTLPASLLRRLNNRDDVNLPSLLREAPDSDPSKALVLFRPLTLPSAEEKEEEGTSRTEPSIGGDIELEEPEYMVGTEDIPIIEEEDLIPSSLMASGNMVDGLDIEELQDDDAMDIE
ncbi:unnamed protein product [Somion occarium]|uniref:Uncharacterized protein n=1 Tax=Somion occarium TaxID=3059160 RepID=A0ABP1DGQ0_9APHY